MKTEVVSLPEAPTSWKVGWQPTGQVLLTWVTVPSARPQTLKGASGSSVLSFLDVGPSSWLEKKKKYGVKITIAETKSMNPFFMGQKQVRNHLMVSTYTHSNLVAALAVQKS